MTDEVGTETTRSDAPGADNALFGDAVDNAPAAAAEHEEDSTDKAGEDPQTPVDAGEQAAGNEAEQAPKGSEVAEESSGVEAENNAAEELKVVVSIKNGRAAIGVQQPSSDPHIETFYDTDLPALAQEVTAVTERAKARWEESPKHPAYERPAPPTRRRNRRQQGAAQDATAETQEAETQQQTLRLF